MSEKVVLPPVAIVNVTPEYIIACPGFFLTGCPVTSNTSSLVVFYNDTRNTANNSVFDMSEYLSSNNN